VAYQSECADHRLQERHWVSVHWCKQAVKGKPFAPDARQKALLEEGVRVGKAMASVNTFEARLQGANWYPGTNWMASVLLDPAQEYSR
jgi:hypothetical protein